MRAAIRYACDHLSLTQRNPRFKCLPHAAVLKFRQPTGIRQMLVVLEASSRSVSGGAHQYREAAGAD